MMPRCYVCPECNGRGPCVGQVPGFGGMGASRGFQANYDSLAAVQLNSRVIHGVHVPDTSIDFFGTKISMPAVAAPTGGTTYNMGGKLTEKEFVTAICGGCTKAGTLGAVADGIGDPLPVFEERLQTLKSLGYKAIVGLKPRLNKDIIERMKLAEQAGVVALTIDLDSAGRAARATKGQTVEPKTFEQLKELVSASPLPLLFKGIMTPDEAELCVQAGADFLPLTVEDYFLAWRRESAPAHLDKVLSTLSSDEWRSTVVRFAGVSGINCGEPVDCRTEFGWWG